MPARSRAAPTSAKPASRNNSPTASAWSWPCSSSNQPPAREMRRRRCDNRAYRVQAVASGRQRLRRLVTQIAFGEMRIAGGDIRRVAGDEIEALAAPMRRTSRTRERDIADAKSLGIARRQRERRSRNVGADDARLAPRGGDRQRHRTRSGAEVENTRLAIVAPAEPARARPAIRSRDAGSGHRA